MSKVTNIGLLDVRNIKKDLAEKIKKISNIGLLIESDESQELLQNCKKSNVGTTLKLSGEINTIKQNGDIELDREYLEGILEPVIILVNGNLTIKEDVDSKLINDRIYSVVINGTLICRKNLLGSIQSKGIVNGDVLGYKKGYNFISENIKLNDRFLKGLKPNSKLAFNRLQITEEIDMELLQEKIANIDILGELIIVDSYEDEIPQYIDEYYSINKTVIPKGAKYIEEDIKLDDSLIKKYNGDIVYVDGEVELYLEEDIEANDHIKTLICSKVICDEKGYNIIKDCLDEEVEIEIIKGKLLKNISKMTLEGYLEEELTIKNIGKLVIGGNLNWDKFNKNVQSIINYGLIEVPKDKINIVKAKVKDNCGKIKTSEDNTDDLQGDEKILYSNMGELKL